MEESFLQKLSKEHKRKKILPGEEEVHLFIRGLLQFLFPQLNNQRYEDASELQSEYRKLQHQLEQLLLNTEGCNDHLTGSICFAFFSGLEAVYDLSIEDAHTLLSEDPAAQDINEVIRAYPGFYGIAIYRIAHLMDNVGIPYLPRIFTEYAHSRTGIDIHPRAQIGRRFCIDHGTGVVIGETTVIGDNVKIYQGVTLGAMSISKDLAQTKRHPNIEDNVVIYAGATILGGETTIGKNSVVGANVWITKSVPPNSKIYYNPQNNYRIK